MWVCREEIQLHLLEASGKNAGAFGENWPSIPRLTAGGFGERDRETPPIEDVRGQAASIASQINGTG